MLIRWKYRFVDELLRRRFAATMSDVADRIVFIRRLNQPEFMSFLSLVDVMLDPFPYGGGNTTLEAFSLGLPVVTLPTKFLRGRITQAFCRRLGLDSCIAQNVADYIQIAARLGTDPALRQQHAHQIIAAQHRIFEDDSAVRDWEQFFRQVCPRAETIFFSALKQLVSKSKSCSSTSAGTTRRSRRIQGSPASAPIRQLALASLATSRSAANVALHARSAGRRSQATHSRFRST